MKSGIAPVFFNEKDYKRYLIKQDLAFIPRAIHLLVTYEHMYANAISAKDWSRVVRVEHAMDKVNKIIVRRLNQIGENSESL